MSEAVDFSQRGFASDEAVTGHLHCLAGDSLFHYRITYTNSPPVLAEVLIMTVPSFINRKKKKISVIV